MINNNNKCFKLGAFQLRLAEALSLSFYLPFYLCTALRKLLCSLTCHPSDQAVNICEMKHIKNKSAVYITQKCCSIHTTWEWYWVLPLAFGIIEHSRSYITAMLGFGVKFRIVVVPFFFFFLNLYLNLSYFNICFQWDTTEALLLVGPRLWCPEIAVFSWDRLFIL